MKQFIIRFSLLSIAYILFWSVQGCTDLQNVGSLPHDKHLVVNGFLRPGVSVRNILIGQSVSPSDTFYVGKTRIFDAEVSISVDGRSYPLRLQPDSAAILQAIGINPYGTLEDQPTYYHAPELIVQAGKTYTLNVKWQGLQATATTIIPPAPEILSSNHVFSGVRLDSARRTFNDNGIVKMYLEYRYNGEIVFRVKPSPQIYWRLESPALLQAENLQPFLLPLSGFGYAVSQNTPIGNNEIEVRTNSIAILPVPPSVTSIKSLAFRGTVFGYDEAYVRYLQTSGRGFGGTGPFGSSGQNPIWNVQGQGVGLFIGQSTAATIIIRP